MKELNGWKITGLLVLTVLALFLILGRGVFILADIFSKYLFESWIASLAFIILVFVVLFALVFK